MFVAAPSPRVRDANPGSSPSTYASRNITHDHVIKNVDSIRVISLKKHQLAKLAAPYREENLMAIFYSIPQIVYEKKW